ncbi:MAG: hypothetical protein JWR19_1639 [Pedosphaera sp.]|nr:hypothetical protein [Pedosphaera sp.]
MKNASFIFLLPAAVLLIFGVVSLGSNTAHGAGPLVWSDEFDGSVIDASHWTYDIGNGPPYPGWGNNELEYYTSRPENAYVSNGMLHVVARQEAYGGQNYTSAKMKTSGLFSKKYGRVEFRAKLPQGQGYWPAVWMMPQSSVYGAWASSGEIDILENRGSAPTSVLGTLHFGGVWPNQAQSHGPSFTFPPGDSVTNFHTYVLEWTTNSIQWIIDDQVYETQTSWWSAGGVYPAPFDQPFYIIVNLAVGGDFGGNPDGTTVFPGEMQIDYIRVYDVAPVLPPPPPVLKLRFGFDDHAGSTTTPSDSGGGVSATLQMVNGAGVNADYHGAAGSGVAGASTGSRTLDFSINGANQPGNPGPLASTTNANLGFGSVSNFVVTLWFKQNALMAAGANLGPRLFVLGGGSPSDTGVANSLGLKFQTSNQVYFQLNGVTAIADLHGSVTTNTWVFLAATYSGTSLAVYEGTDSTPASLVTNIVASTNVDFGALGTLYVGNKQNRQRSFNGWIDDFRFYTGVGDANFVESIRLLAANPPTSLTAAGGDNQVNLGWIPASGATGYNLKRATISGGPYATVASAGSLVGTNYNDATAVNGTKYFYVVSAVNNAGEGPNSLEANVTAACVPPPAPVASNNGPISAGMTLNLAAATVAGATYNWTGPDGFAATNQNPSIVNVTTNAAGSYSVTATVGSCSSAAATTVTISPPIRVSIEWSGTNMTLRWPNGTLQSASNLFGPWYDVPGVIGPYAIDPVEQQQFYRIKLQ